MEPCVHIPCIHGIQFETLGLAPMDSKVTTISNCFVCNKFLVLAKFSWRQEAISVTGSSWPTKQNLKNIYAKSYSSKVLCICQWRMHGSMTVIMKRSSYVPARIRMNAFVTHTMQKKCKAKSTGSPGCWSQNESRQTLEREIASRFRVNQDSWFTSDFLPWTRVNSHVRDMRVQSTLLHLGIQAKIQQLHKFHRQKPFEFSKRKSHLTFDNPKQDSCVLFRKKFLSS